MAAYANFMRTAMRPIHSVTIFFLFALVHNLSAQTKRTMHFSMRNGAYCSQSMILDSSGLFFQESGCEGRSKISFGRYQMGKDNRISFVSLPFDSINPVAKIVEGESVTENDSITTITFYDRYHRQLGFNFGIRLGDTGNLVHEMWTDESGAIQVNRHLYKKISFIQLLWMYKETDGIAIGQKSLKVYLNFPEQFLIQSELQIEHPRKTVLQLKQNGLYDPRTKKRMYQLD
jgi:hypothetical protein